MSMTREFQFLQESTVNKLNLTRWLTKMKNSISFAVSYVTTLKRERMDQPSRLNS